MTDAHDLEYVGFWPRVGASLIDALLLMLVTAPITQLQLLNETGDFYSRHMLMRHHDNFWTSYVLPAALVIAFWHFRQATPGKMAIRAKIVDARTGRPPGLTQYLIRYVGYFVSTIPAGLGFLWIVFDSRHQGWHDKMAGTVVVRPIRPPVEPVHFDGSGDGGT